MKLTPPPSPPPPTRPHTQLFYLDRIEFQKELTAIAAVMLANVQAMMSITGKEKQIHNPPSKTASSSTYAPLPPAMFANNILLPRGETVFLPAPSPCPPSPSASSPTRVHTLK